MDLLRLVLVEQPAEKLFTMPRLERRAFLRTRAQKFGGTAENLARDATCRGDLTSISHNFVESRFLMERAIFLRKPGIYVMLAGGLDYLPDFWTAMASGIPEIQAAAIAVFVLISETSPRDEIPIEREFIEKWKTNWK